MKRLITICAAVGLIMAVTGTAQADLDIHGIYIDSCKDFWNGTPETNPWVLEISVDFVSTGDLDHIDVTKPGTSTPFAIYEDYGDWHYGSTEYSSLGDLRDDYPTGEYTFDFRSSSSSLLTFKLDYSGIDEPGDFVHITSPTHLATDVSLNPTFTWTIDSDAGDALGMWVEDPYTGEAFYENVPVSMTTTSWAPGPLLPSHDYEFDVSVFNVKNPPAFPTMTVGSDTFTYGLLIEYCNDVEFTTVPEPATICLLGLGVLGLLHRRK